MFRGDEVRMSGKHILLDIIDAKNPIALRFILFAAIKNCTFRRVSLCTWIASNNGSKNYTPV